MNLLVRPNSKGYPVKFLLLFFMSLISAAGTLSAQVPIGKATGGPFFFLDASNFASKDTAKGRVEVFVKLAFSELSFVKYQTDFYRAEYEIDYTISKTTNKKDSLVAREFQNREIVLDKFDETSSDLRFHFSRITFNLLPGEYSLVVTVTDKETQKFGQRKLDIPVKTFRERSVGISDLIFADKIQKDSTLDIINIVPNVFKSFDNEYKKYAVYFEIYDGRFSKDSSGKTGDGADRFKINYRVLDKNQKLVMEDSTDRTVSQFQTFSSIDIDKKSVNFGKYILDVTISNGLQKASSKSIFDVRLSTFSAPSLSATAFDLDNAIKEMRHVARNVNLSKTLKGTRDEKEKFFNEFWKAKDPTPATERNELMEEYYRRIDYANRYFTSGFREGWDTDRGMVFVIMESPDDIERHPFETNSKPYEIWYYYQSNLRLYFVDFNSVGDYELYNRQDFENYVFLH